MSKRLGQQARDLIGKNWSKSQGTREKLLGNVRSIADFMQKQGLNRIQDMKTKHVLRYVEHMKNNELAATTMANHMTAMRVLAGAIGKQNIVPRTNTELGIVRTGRYTPKQADIGLQNKIIKGLYEKDEWLGLAAEMRQQFGLRSKESLLSREVVIREGVPFLVVEGAKGGRKRELAIDSSAKAEMVSRVQVHIRAEGKTTLIPANLTLKQGYDRQRNALNRLGATKETNSNAHLSRHQVAQKMALEGVSDQRIAEHLGHNRADVVRHYK